jgi:hypothetical protein
MELAKRTNLIFMNKIYSDSIMSNATEIIVTTGFIGGGLVLGLGLLFQLLKKSPTRSSGGGRTRRARRANNGTRRS